MDYKVFTKPVHVTTWMGVFLALVAGLAAFLVPQLKHAFMANAAFIRSAPMKIRKIRAALVAVPRKHSWNLRHVISRLATPVISVNAAPTAAPSVGVKKPP